MPRPLCALASTMILVMFPIQGTSTAEEKSFTAARIMEAVRASGVDAITGRYSYCVYEQGSRAGLMFVTRDVIIDLYGRDSRAGCIAYMELNENTKIYRETERGREHGYWFTSIPECVRDDMRKWYHQLDEFPFRSSIFWFLSDFARS